jgi:hypothetical protein
LVWKLEGGKKKFNKDLSFKFFNVDGDEIDIYVKNNKTNKEFRATMTCPEIIEIY